MTENLSNEIIKALDCVCTLHEQAVCNHDKCREFSEQLSELLDRLEDLGYFRTADRVMSVLMNCSPKEASHCEKATLVGEMMKNIKKEAQKAAGI